MKKKIIGTVSLSCVCAAGIASAQGSILFLTLPAILSGAVTTTATSSTSDGAYSQSGGTVTQTGKNYSATATDQSAVYVTNGGTYALSSAKITKSGDTSSDENSSFYGLNAAVLAEEGSTINLYSATVVSNGTGANGVFSTGSGSVVNLADATIEANGDGAHGVMATQGAKMTVTNVNITTSDVHSAAIATDRGGGTITVTGGTVTTTGEDSPCYYSTGTLSISDSTCNAPWSESVVIEGANSVAITDSDLTSGVSNKWGVMIYQSLSGDAEGRHGVFTMTSGSLTHSPTDGPLFYVTNAAGTILLKGVNVSVGSGVLVQAEGNSRWGTSGSNGGNVVLTAITQTLKGSMTADALSTITATLKSGSSLTGAINAAGTADSVNLTLDGTSTWSVSADSYLSCLTDSTGISGTGITNIYGNNHTVYYDSSACSALGGQTYTLSGGGSLQPLD